MLFKKTLKLSQTAATPACKYFHGPRMSTSNIVLNKYLVQLCLNFMAQKHLNTEFGV